MKGWRSMGFLYGVALVAAAFVLVSLVPVPPHDFWWYLRLGQDILREGTIPTADAYSWTRYGAPVAYHSWLSAVGLYALYRTGGLPLVVAVNALSVAALFGGAYWLAWRASGRYRLAAVAASLGLLMSSNNWAVRPQSFAFPLFALTLALAWPATRGEAPRRVWLLPAIVALWVNVHGSFVLAPLIVGAVWAGLLVERLVSSGRFALRHGEQETALGRLRRPANGQGNAVTLARLGGVLALMLLAALVNPRGPGALAYVVRLLTDPPSQAFIVEWQPPRPTTPQGALFFASLVVLMAALAWAPRRPRPPHLFLLALFAGMGLVSTRYVVWYAAALPLLVSALFSMAGQGGREEAFQPTLHVATLAVLVALPLLLNPWTKARLPLPEKVAVAVTPDTPVAAATWLRQHPQGGPLFNEMGYGSYLIWAVPEVPVFIDTRVELYPLAQWNDYAAISGGRYDYEALLARWGVGRVMADKVRQPALVAALRQNPRWQVVYEDERTVIAEVEP